MILPREREHRRTVLEVVVLVGSLALIASFLSAGAWPSEVNVELQAMVDEVVNHRLEVIDETLTLRAESESGSAFDDHVYAGSLGESPRDSRGLVLESGSPRDAGNPG